MTREQWSNYQRHYQRERDHEERNADHGIPFVPCDCPPREEIHTTYTSGAATFGVRIVRNAR